MTRKTKQDHYFTTRLGVILLIFLTFLVFMGDVDQDKTKLIRPEFRVEVKAYEPKTIPEMIVYYSDKYKVNPMLTECILFHESGFRPQAVGDSGKAVGIAQFHYPTWKMFRNKMGLSEVDLRTNPEESIRTLCWALSEGYANHWSPYKNGVCQLK